MLLFLLDGALMLAFAALTAAVLRLPSRASFLVGVFVLVWADLVVSTEVLSLIGHLSRPAMLLAHALSAIAGLALWRRAGRPLPVGFRRPEVGVLKGLLSRRPELSFLGATVVVAWAVNAGLILVVRQDNYDSMRYHLSRVCYWIQHGTMAPWPTLSDRQTAFPPNAEIGSLWSMLFLETDVATGFVQWTAGVAAMVAIFGSARCLGFSRSQAIFAALVWATLPEVLLQSTTTQNDLVAASLLASALYCLLLGLRHDHRGSFLLSAAALGLAAGTKVTVAMTFPGLAAGCALIAVLRGRPAVRRLIPWGAACVAGFFLMGSYIYISNWYTYSHPLGTERLIRHNTKESQGFDGRLLITNLLRDLYEMADPTGLPEPLLSAAGRLRSGVGEKVFRILAVDANAPGTTLNRRSVFNFDRQLRPNEDFSWFGPLGFLLWLPVVLCWTFRGIRRRRGGRFLLAAAFISFIVGVGAAQSWHGHRGRFYVIPFTVAAPLIASVYRRDRRLDPTSWLIVSLAVVITWGTLTTNRHKPLVGPGSVWQADLSNRFAFSNPATGRLIRRLEELIPPDATVAMVASQSFPDYALFGEGCSRTLIPIVPRPKLIDEAWLDDHRYAFVVVDEELGTQVEKPLTARYRVVEVGRVEVVVRSSR